MDETAILLDIIALIPPTIGLTLLFRKNANLKEIKSSTVLGANCYFMAVVTFDLLLNLGFSWAALGVLFSLWFLYSVIGFFAATLYLSPESWSLKESYSRVFRSIYFHSYEATILGWLIATLYLQTSYLPANTALWVVTTIYPTSLFLLARKRAKTNHLRDMLKILYTAWFILSLFSLPPLLFTSETPLLGITLPIGYQISFLTSSLFYYFLATAITDPTGLSKRWMSRLAPQTIIELGKRYLVLHDTGTRTISFLSNTFRGLIESGTRVVVRMPRQSWLFESLIQADRRFTEWVGNGKLVSTSDNENSFSPSRALAEKINPGSVSTVFVRGLDAEDLLNDDPSEAMEKENSLTSQLFLVERSRTPGPRLDDFLKRNEDIQVIDLSEPKEYFSSLINFKHEQLQGSKILLEHDSSADLGVVEKFFMEGIAYAEKCVLFTSKSSKLYRAIKGREHVKIIAASSLVSVIDELEDGEVQIPDRELGLVTSIASDLLENNKTTAVRFAFDSLPELVRGDHWEQVYAGVKQLVELLGVPHATALFLVNADTLDPKFLAALRSVFSLQLRATSEGVRVQKLPSK